MRGFVLGAVSAIALLSSANAADIYVPSPAGPGGYKDVPWYPSWAGFYVGVNGGWAWSEHNDQFAFSTTFKGLDPQGGFGGGQIGYNWQSGHFVFGVEADIQGSAIEDKGHNVPAVPASFKSDLDWFGTVRGRLGYAFGSSLLYATGGFAYGGLRNEIVNGAGIVFKNHDTATGFTVGGGWEYKFGPAWSLKAEYQFIDLGRNDPEVTIAGITTNLCTAGGGLTCRDDAFHTVRVGLNYHFGTGYVPLK